MNWFFNPNDWLGRHPRVCLVLLMVLLLLVGAIECSAKQAEEERAAAQAQHAALVQRAANVAEVSR